MEPVQFTHLCLCYPSATMLGQKGDDQNKARRRLSLMTAGRWLQAMPMLNQPLLS